MKAGPKAGATYADLCALPDNQVGELIDGVLHASPRPSSLHAVAASAVQTLIGGAFGFGIGGPGGWVVLVEPELRFGANVLVPDIAAWRRERMPEVPVTAQFELVPDWLCEVLSPSTAQLDRRDKLRVYAAAGVAHVWLIDPVVQSLECLALDGATYRLSEVAGGDQHGRYAPFAAIELTLSLLWQR